MSHSDDVKFPKLLRHKPTNRAYVMARAADGSRRAVYLGTWGTKAAKHEYAKFVERLAAGRGRMPAAGTTPLADISVNEVILKFAAHADGHYRRADGTPTQEISEFRQTFRVLKLLYGETTANEFGPVKLKAVRQAFVERGLCRTIVNRRTLRVRHLFKWATEQELVRPDVHHSLTTVAGLQFGRTTAYEREPVEPVADELVDATVLFLSRHVAGLIRFQRLTGCRPGEACLLRMSDVDATGPVWLFRPAHHKLIHRNKPRVVHVGPKAQELIKLFPTEHPAEYLFSPRKAMAEFQAMRAAARRTKKYVSHMRRNVTKRKAKPARTAGDRYTTHTVGQAIRKAIDGENRRRLTAAMKEGTGSPELLERWHPNQLRHTFATVTRKEFGLEAAQVLLGHERADVTQVYAERDQKLAQETAAKAG